MMDDLHHSNQGAAQAAQCWGSSSQQLVSRKKYVLQENKFNGGWHPQKAFS